MSDYKIASIQIDYHLDEEGDVTKIELASNFGADADDFAPLLLEALARMASPRSDRQAETRTNQTHVTLNPYRQEPGVQDADLNPSKSMGIEQEDKDR